MAPLTQFPEETKYWKMTRKPGSQRGLFAENLKCRRITQEMITWTAFKLRERRKNSSPFVYVLHKMWNSRRSFAGTAKKRTKKRDARVELLFCSSNLLLFGRSCCRRRRSFVRSLLGNNDGDGNEKATLIKSEVALLQTLSRLFHLVQFIKCWHLFKELNSKRLYQSSGEET